MNSGDQPPENWPSSPPQPQYPPPQQYPPSYQQPQQPYAPQQPYIPQYYYPPPRKKNTGLIIGVTAAVVAVVILLVLFFVLNPFASKQSNASSPLVGTWHITEEKVTYSDGTSHYSSVDLYIEFHPDGTGKWHGYEEYSYISFTFNWKDNGDNTVTLSNSTGSTTTSVTMHYTINGDNIELSYTYYGDTYTYYGEKSSGEGTAPTLVASLYYDSAESDPAGGYVYLDVSLSEPPSASWTKIEITINGVGGTLSGETDNYIGGYTVDIEDWDDSGTLTDGDEIYIYGDGSLEGATISLSIVGYSGVVAVTIPYS